MLSNSTEKQIKHKKCSSGLWCSEKESSIPLSVFVLKCWEHSSAPDHSFGELGGAAAVHPLPQWPKDSFVSRIRGAESRPDPHSGQSHTRHRYSLSFWSLICSVVVFFLVVVSLFASLLIIVFDWNPSRVICHLLSVCADFFTGSDSIQGTWCKDILQTIMSFTPHNWASHTLSCFPAPLQVQILCYAKYSSDNCGLLLFFSVK